jgi:hypothetical protein
LETQLHSEKCIYCDYQVMIVHVSHRTRREVALVEAQTEQREPKAPFSLSIGVSLESRIQCLEFEFNNLREVVVRMACRVRPLSAIPSRAEI